MFGQLLAEVERLAVIIVLHAVVEVDWQRLERVAGLGCQVAVGAQVVEHHVAAAQAVFWIDFRIVG